MENPSRLRKFQQSPSVSPRLIRSRSTSIAPLSLLPDLQTRTPGSRTSKTVQKPKTSSRKTQKNTEDVMGRTSVNGGFVRFIPNNESKKIDVKRQTRSASTSPSAWALSPGRSISCPSPAKAELAPHLPKSPASFCKLIKGEGESGGVNSVLKYFRQKKVSTVQEEEYHQFRVAYNRLLQWRFANARAEATMAAVKHVAQKKLFNGWAKISLMRNFIAEKQGKIQRLKHEIKLYRTLPSQVNLLNEWAKLEPKNVEAVGRVVRKLSAISHCLPLVHDAKGDIISTKDAMLSATKVMNNIQQDLILDMHQQVEIMCFLLTELSIMLKQQKQFFQELEKSMKTVAKLEVHEKNLIVHQLQLVKEVNENRTIVTGFC